MKFLHTSDWHLGRSFHGVGLLEAQQVFLDHLVGVVREHQVDAVLIAGDIYDRALPSPDAVAVLSRALTALVDAGAVVVVSSGNHDSATRLGFGADLMSAAGVHIRTGVADLDKPVIIDGAAIYALPYLEPTIAAGPLDAAERSHTAVLSAAMDRVRADMSSRGRPAVVLAHAFVNQAAQCDSEREISVGGVASVPMSVFDGPVYVALGHLHGAQQMSPRVRYCGSPLAMSFSESKHTKGMWLGEVCASGQLDEVTFIPSPVPRPLRILRGELEAVLTDPSLADAQEAWCQVILTDATRPKAAMERLRARFPHTLELQHRPQDDVARPERTYSQRLSRAEDPLDVVYSFVEHVRGGAPADDAERTLLQAAWEAARVNRRSVGDEGQIDLSEPTSGATSLLDASSPANDRRSDGCAVA